MLAVGGENLDDGVGGVDFAGVVLKPDLPANKAAAVPVIGTVAA
jgi:hypothetical protein